MTWHEVTGSTGLTITSSTFHEVDKWYCIKNTGYGHLVKILSEIMLRFDKAKFTRNCLCLALMWWVIQIAYKSEQNLFKLRKWNISLLSTRRKSDDSAIEL